MVDAPPTADKILQTGLRKWEIPEHRPNPTLSRGAFKTYSTYVDYWNKSPGNLGNADYGFIELAPSTLRGTLLQLRDNWL